MRKTKRIVWLAAAALAAVLAAVAGCKHDDEDDWTPVTIRGTMLEKYAGQRTDVTIPDGVTGIGSRAFSDSDVTAVVIPSGVTSIDANAFEDSKVTSVSYLGTLGKWNELVGGGLPDNIKVSCFIIEDGILIRYEGDEIDVVIPAGFVKGIADKDIGDGVFSGRDITVVTIPGSVRRVGTHTFAGCTALVDVRIEAGVADIGDGAFAGCTKLESATIPAGARRLGGGIFNGCTGLTGLSVHESVTEIAPGALAGTERLEAITYTGRKAQWEKLVVGKERDFAGKRVYCQDGEDWWYGPERDTGDDPSHTHDFKYDFLDKDTHKKGCKLCDYAETEAHEYDDSDTECNKCGYRKAISGDSGCDHNLIVKHNAGGHYQKCTKCDYQSASVPHEWSKSYTNGGTSGHYQNCTVCGYQSDPMSHKYKYEKIDDGKHRVTCEVCDYSADMTHDWSEIYTSGGADGHYRTCASCGEKFGIAAHDFKYEFDKDNHQVGCKVCDYSKTEAHVYDDDSDTECNECGYAREISGNSECDHNLIVAHNESGHYQKCTECDYQSASVNHAWGEYKDNLNGTHSRSCTAEGCGYTETQAHSLGECESDGEGGHKKTCTARCGYSEPVSHVWGDRYEKDAGKHYKTCTISGCTAHDEGKDHDYNGAPYKDDGNGGHYQECTVCDYQAASVPHTWSGYTYDDKAHSRTCTAKGCGYTETQAHSLGECESDGEGGHKKTCTARCGYSEPVSHIWGDRYEKDADKHYKTCTISGCTAHDEGKDHDYTSASYKDDGNGGHYQECTVCKHPSVSVEHTWSEYKYTSDSNGHDRICTATGCGHAEHLDCRWNEYTYDNNTHTRTCMVTGKAHTENDGHSYTYPDSQTHLDIKHKKMCETCGYSIDEDHNWKYDCKDDKQHEKGCTLCTYGKSEEHEYEYADNNNGTHTKTCKQKCADPVTEKHKYVSGACACGRQLQLDGAEFDENGVLIKYNYDQAKNQGIVIIPEGVTGIGEGVFKDCTNLKNVTIPDSVTSIGDNAFQNCCVLEKVDIPDNVTSIGKGAFQDCNNLKTVTLHQNVTSIGEGAFQDCKVLEKVNIPGNVENIGNSAFQGCTNLKDVTISDGVTSIGEGAFQKCSNLTTITIPKTVKNVEKDAFNECDKLETVIIEDGVGHIKKDAFKDCIALKRIEIPGSVSEIGDGAFFNCSALTDVVILDGVEKTIGERAFSFCSPALVNVTIPSSVIYIGPDAFTERDGTSGVKNVTFTGTQEQWDAITGGGKDSLPVGVTILGSSGG